MAASNWHTLPSVFLLILTIFPLLCYCLYEDQAGKFDWRQQYVGKVSFVTFEQTSQTGRSLLVATEQNVLASLNARNGQIGWRSLLEDGDKGRIDAMIHVQNANALITVHGGGTFVRSWQTTTGHINWEYRLEVENAKKRSSAALFGVESFDDSVAVLHGSKVTILGLSNGHKVWDASLPKSESVQYELIDSKSQDLVVVGFSSASEVYVVTYNKKGQLTSQKPHSDPWLTANSKCKMFEGEMFCVENQILYNAFVRTPLQELGVSDHSEDEVKSLNVLKTSDQSIMITIQWSKGISILTLNNGKLTLVKDLPDALAVQVVTEDDTDVIFTLRRTSAESVKVTGFDFESREDVKSFNQELHVASHHGDPEQVHTLSFRKRDGSTGYKYLILCKDHSITMLQQSGKVTWTREEGLASVISAKMVDLPVSENQAKMEDEFGSHEADVFSLFFKRICTQLSQVKLQHKIHSHKHHEGVDETDEDDELDMTRDDFSLHKMIILVSAAGKVYGMYSPTGKLVWRHFFPYLGTFERNGRPTMPLFVQRTTAHFPHPPQATILGIDKLSGKSAVFTFDPITGESINKQGLKVFDFKAMQVSLTAQVDEHFLRGIIFLDTNLKVHVYPEEMKRQVADQSNIIYLFTVESATGLIVGYGVKPKRKSKRKIQEINAEELWRLNLGSERQKITHVVAKRSSEHVHSLGRVLGDRSVLYKYLNPNAVVIAAEGIDESTKQGFLNLYLVDVVNGNVVFSVNHKRVMGPINIAHSENFVIYNYWNQKNRRNEITVLELFEGNKQSNSTAFSSFSPPPVPLTMRQAYILPTGVSTMTVTITEKGITDKHILMALNIGSILQMPKAFLDPRRPVTPTPEHREEGVLPYIPELPVMTENVINYNLSMYNVRDIYTAPAGLESTCLVLASGLDLFFTRVAPSKMYDVLKDDFDYFFISSVLMSMIIVSILTQKLAVRKALNRNWK
ncbi:ER membrane protein complex subunit 1-like isoform X2 [Tubulanus polymorphus]|uniref:ER membrane protein complex subunit 1-like isoform X2 n=1 Tax=Tubulanus polymorphus TaxID=672921 RepID=UPI003DA36810